MVQPEIQLVDRAQPCPLLSSTGPVEENSLVPHLVKVSLDSQLNLRALPWNALPLPFRRDLDRLSGLILLTGTDSKAVAILAAGDADPSMAALEDAQPRHISLLEGFRRDSDLCGAPGKQHPLGQGVLSLGHVVTELAGGHRPGTLFPVKVYNCM